MIHNHRCSESANVNIGMMIGNTGYIEGKKNYNLAAGDAREIIILLPEYYNTKSVVLIPEFFHGLHSPFFHSSGSPLRNM